MNLSHSELILPESYKQQLQNRLRPIVAAGEIPDKGQLPDFTQQVVSKILREVIPENFLKEFQSVAQGEKQLVVFKNFPTLEWLLPQTPEKESEEFSREGYSSLILMGLNGIQKRETIAIDNLTDNYKTTKHRDSSLNCANSLFCIRDADVATNFYSFNDIMRHEELAPYLGALMKNDFSIHELKICTQETLKINGPYPVIKKDNAGLIKGTEISLYKESEYTKVVPLNQEAAQAWGFLCNFLKRDDLHPTYSVILRQGDIVIFNDTFGLHERDTFNESENPFCKRWLKRAVPYGNAKELTDDIENLELRLPDMIRNHRLKESLEDPYYAAFLTSKLQR